MILGNTSGEVAGWGITSAAGHPADVLMHTEMPSVRSDLCSNAFQAAAKRFNLTTNYRAISENMFCAGSP